MYKIKFVNDLEECRCIWKKYWPQHSIFDLWEVRNSFVEPFRRNSVFIILENRKQIEGILPLSWIEEKKCYSFFPGETWQGKTWMEQNRVYAATQKAFNLLMESVPGSLYIRYLYPNSECLNHVSISMDEINYACLPGHFGYSFDGYMQQFSSKSRRNLNKELSQFDAYGVEFRYDNLSDLDTMFSMNKASYGEFSYFNDPRFMKSFDSLISWLQSNGMLRITTALIGGKVAAVDMGTVCNGTYTLLAGGTHPEFPGVAKLINFHHMKWGCEQKMECIDFLCGDFGWKQRFHLTPRPLYEIHSNVTEEYYQPELAFNQNEMAYAL